MRIYLRLWLLFVCGILIGSVLQQTARSQEPSIKDLAEAQFKAAQEAYRAYIKSGDAGGVMVDPERMYQLSRRLLAAELDVNEKKEQRIKACKEHLARMVELLADTKKRDTGSAIRPDLIITAHIASAEFFRAEAELLLARESKRDK